ncbi:MAG: hypothetical protein RSD62_06600 [Ruthenibacterium sp.]
MKNTKISAILFAMLAVVQMLLVRSFTMNSAFGNLPIFAVMEIAAVVVFAVLALWMIKSEALCCSKKQALVLGGALYVVFAAMNWMLELGVVQMGLSTISTALTGMPAVIVVLVIKLALLAGAVAFAVIPEHKAAKTQSTAEAAAAAEQESISADTVAEAAEAAVTDSISE